MSVCMLGSIELVPRDQDSSSPVPWDSRVNLRLHPTELLPKGVIYRFHGIGEI